MIDLFYAHLANSALKGADRPTWLEFLLFYLDHSIPYLHSSLAQEQNLRGAPESEIYGEPKWLLDEGSTDPFVLQLFDCQIPREVPSLKDSLRGINLLDHIRVEIQKLRSS